MSLSTEPQPPWGLISGQREGNRGEAFLDLVLVPSSFYLILHAVHPAGAADILGPKWGHGPPRFDLSLDF